MSRDPLWFFKKHARRLALWRVFADGFTILELLVAMAILSIMVVLMLGVLQSTSDAWRRNTDRTKAFAAARAAFESMTRSISAATLNTYQDYYDSNTSLIRSNRASGSLTFVPAVYGRRSDLHFTTGTNLVTGQRGGAIFMTVPFDYESNNTNDYSSGQLNGIGYFVRFTTNSLRPAGVSNNPFRYRLMQFLEPTEQLMVMNTTNKAWFTNDVNANTNIFPIADNVVAFAVLPQLSDRENPTGTALSSDFGYDTRMTWSNSAANQPTNMHQLPPVVQVIMVVLDESSAKRIENGSTEPTVELGFDPASVFTGPANLETDLKTISDALSAKRLNYRIFRSEIPIRSAKWTIN
jgi:uncharacterized protein (TIGR02599 family)